MRPANSKDPGTPCTSSSLRVLTLAAILALAPASASEAGSDVSLADVMRAKAEVKTVGTQSRSLTSLELEKSRADRTAERALEAERSAAAMRMAVPGFAWLPEWMRTKAAQGSTYVPGSDAGIHPRTRQKMEQTAVTAAAARAAAGAANEVAAVKGGGVTTFESRNPADARSAKLDAAARARHEAAVRAKLEATARQEGR